MGAKNTFCLITIFICAAFKSASISGVQNYEPKLNLITPYTFSIEKDRFAEPPYVATFQDRRKTLFYIAAEHVSVEKYPNLLKHPTFLTIQKLFTDHTIEAVIVEGIAPWKGLIPTALLDHGNECESTGYKADCGEPWFVIQQARRTHTMIFTGEPSEAEILNTIKAHGYSIQDLLGFYIVRQIPSWKREGLFHGNGIKKLIEARLVSYRRDLGLTEKFDYRDFETWYRKNMQNPADFATIESNDTAPLSTSGATFIQKISSVIGMARDCSVVTHIAQALNNYSNVLVVYGASHFLVEKNSLEQMVAKPNYKKLF
jgi:hypothetical protein